MIVSTFILTFVICSTSILYLNPHNPSLRQASSTLTVNAPCGTDLVCRLFLRPPRANTSLRTTYHSSLHPVPHNGAPYCAMSQDATLRRASSLLRATRATGGSTLVRGVPGQYDRSLWNPRKDEQRVINSYSAGWSSSHQCHAAFLRSLPQDPEPRSRH